ncbi:MAG: tetratricopeptide repeat protein [Anaerolineae bacterium]|nr:tetratricopeptide repeat protein [Anaerolineae bacterium]
MSDEVIKEAVAAIQNGDRRRARRLLGQVVNVEPDNLSAWWYLAAALEDSEQRIHCLKQVLRIQPDHAEAKQVLSQLERRIAQVTPPTGTTRPVVDAYQDKKSDHLLVSKPAAESGAGSESKPLGDVAVAAISMGVALLAIAIAVILAVTGRAADFIGSPDIEFQPTLQPLTFGIEACTTSEDGSTRLVFINNAPIPIEIVRGPEGSEEELISLEPGEQAPVDVDKDLRVRYAVKTTADGYTGSGASFQVSSGSVCLVPVQ